jgi:hypothetical protein
MQNGRINHISKIYSNNDSKIICQNQGICFKKKIEKREGKGLLKSLINGIGTTKVFMKKVLEATLRKKGEVALPQILSLILEAN